MDPTSVLNASDFIGPVGGLIGVAFAAGAVAGWAFCQRTMLTVANRRIEEKDRRIDDLEREAARLEAFFYTMGMERQLAQVRRSTERVLGIEPPKE